jgi:hypothetical protein
MADIYETTIIAAIILSAMAWMLVMAYRAEKAEEGEQHVAGYTLAKNEEGLWEAFIGSPSGFYSTSTGYAFKRLDDAVSWAIKNEYE